MKIKEFVKIMEEIAPLNYKESYDNVGLMVGDASGEVKRILVALDCTKDVIKEAEAIGAEIILSHHPLLFRKPSSITEDTLQGEKIRALIKKDIALYSSHTNWDSVEGGINEEFAKILGFKESTIIERSPLSPKAGIGRVIEFEDKISISDFIGVLKEKFELDYLRYSGSSDKKISRVALINGSGQDFFELAYRMGVDAVVTGDTTYHYVSDYTEMGMSIIDIGHFSSEWILLKSLASRLSERPDFCGVEIVLSKSCVNPYKFA